MRWVGGCLGLVTLLAHGAEARAAEPELPASTGPRMPRAPRLRLTPVLGAALPLGAAYSGQALSNLTPTGFLFGFDLGWGQTLNWDFGFSIMSSLGLGEPRVCPQPSDSCSLAISGQFAPRFRYYFSPEQVFDPWLGLGAGVDVLSSTGTTTTTDSSFFSNTTTTDRKESYFGPFLLLQVGADLRLRRYLFLGPQVGLALSRYSSVSRSTIRESTTYESTSASLDASFHAWLYLALNLTFDVRLY